MTAEVIVGRLSDGGADEIGVEPDFDALEFAGVDGLLHTVNIHLVEAEDDASDGVLVDLVDERIDGIGLEVDLGDDLDFLEDGRGEFGEEFLDGERFASDDDRFPKLAVVDGESVISFGEPGAEEQKSGSDEKEEEEEGAARDIDPKEDDAETEDEDNERARFENLVEFLCWGVVLLVGVEAVKVEKGGAKGHEDSEHPDIFRKGGDLVEEVEVDDILSSEEIAQPEGEA